MSLNLSLEKGENTTLNLSKGNPLTQVNLGLGWDVTTASHPPYDLDSIVVLLGEDGKFHSTQAESTAFFNNLNPLPSVSHLGDNRTGQGEGDDETIQIGLSTLPESVKRVLAAAVIYEAPQRSQNFGQVENAYARIYAPDGTSFETQNGEVSEIRYDLTEDFSNAYTVEVCELYRHNGGWKIKALGNGSKDDLGAFLAKFVK